MLKHILLCVRLSVLLLGTLPHQLFPNTDCLFGVMRLRFLTISL
jgi:hypothetical protein